MSNTVFLGSNNMASANACDMLLLGYWSQFNSVLGKILVPLGKNALTDSVLTPACDTMWYHGATVS